MEETPNHGLNKYSLGEQDWTHSPDMQHIEERLVARDTEANLGTYTPHAGAIFIATDTGAVYDGDGTNWNAATRELESVATDRAEVGTAPRYDLVTNADHTIDVSNFDTLQAAIDEAQKRARDEVVVDIPAGADFSTEFPIMRGVRAEGYTTGGETGAQAGELGIVQIQGDSTNPPVVGGFDAVGCDFAARVFDVTFTGDKLTDDTSKTHLEEEACVAFTNCQGVALFDCTFNSGTSTQAVFNFSSTIECRRVDFGTGNFATLGVNKGVGAETVLTGCSGRPNTSGVWSLRDPLHKLQVSGTGPFATNDTEVVDVSNIDHKKVSAEFLPFYLMDDFGDNSLQDRDAANVGRYATVEDGVVPATSRPRWYVGAGSPSVSNSELVLLAGDEVLHQTRFSTGRWTGRFQFQTTPSGSPLRFLLINDSGANDRLNLLFRTDGTAELLIQDAGTTLSSISGTWAADTSVYDWEVTRDRNGNCEFFVDGTSIGTVTETFLPALPNKFEIQNASDDEVHVHDILIE